MTDTAVEPGAWVPRLGDSTIPAGHAELIRGLYRLAAWVADHPEIPAPRVQARVWPARFDRGWDADCALVDQVALALGVEPEYRAQHGHYEAGASFGPVEVDSVAITDDHMARYDAYMSYADNVQPDERETDADRAATVAGGAR